MSHQKSKTRPTPEGAEALTVPEGIVKTRFTLDRGPPLLFRMLIFGVCQKSHSRQKNPFWLGFALLAFFKWYLYCVVWCRTLPENIVFEIFFWRTICFVYILYIYHVACHDVIVLYFAICIIFWYLIYFTARYKSLSMFIVFFGVFDFVFF